MIKEYQVGTLFYFNYFIKISANRQPQLKSFTP